MVQESAAVRATLPGVLEEVRKTRAAIPPMLTRAEHIVKEARGISTTAAGAVTGALTGVVQAPIVIVGALAATLVGEQGQQTLDDSDYPIIDEHVRKLLASPDKRKEIWRNPANHHAGEIVVLSRARMEGQPCVRLRIGVLRDRQRMQGEERTLCRDAAGNWVLQRPEEPGD